MYSPECEDVRNSVGRGIGDKGIYRSEDHLASDKREASLEAVTCGLTFTTRTDAMRRSKAGQPLETMYERARMIARLRRTW